jgi:hypothetical protein
MGRISNTIELAKSSWAVLKADKELAWLPALSGIASIIVAATFVIPIFALSDDVEASTQSPMSYVVLFVMYVALAYVTIFFNAALIHAANERLDGGDPTLGSALRGARAKAGQILPWAIVSATVSIILRAIEERAGFVGRLVAGFVGLAWTLVTYLVLPTLVLRDVGVGDAIKESGRLFKQTWGENVAAQIGFGLLGFVASLPAIAIIFLAVVSGSGAVIGTGIAVAVVWLITVSVVMTALSGIFQTALYRFATTGSAGGGFNDTTLRTAFRQK